MKTNKKTNKKTKEKVLSKKIDNLGFGGMMGMLSGDEEMVDILNGAIGKTITKAELIDGGGVNAIRLWFGENGIEIWDGGQSCCECRYTTTDDNPSDLVGKKLTKVEVADGPDTDDDDNDVHEVQFLRIHAEDETVVFETHNEHNGWYGGFWIQAKEI